VNKEHDSSIQIIIEYNEETKNVSEVLRNIFDRIGTILDTILNYDSMSTIYRLLKNS